MGFYRFSEDEVQEIKKRLDEISFELKNKQRTEPDQSGTTTKNFSS